MNLVETSTNKNLYKRVSTEVIIVNYHKITMKKQVDNGLGKKLVAMFIKNA